MAPSPLTSRHIGHFSLSGFARLGSLCPPGFAPHYVAYKASRCRRHQETAVVGHCPNPDAEVKGGDAKYRLDGLLGEWDDLDRHPIDIVFLEENL